MDEYHRGAKLQKDNISKTCCEWVFCVFFYDEQVIFQMLSVSGTIVAYKIQSHSDNSRGLSICFADYD